jgi:uncharacterized protein YneF (UPF0154 family)
MKKTYGRFLFLLVIFLFLTCFSHSTFCLAQDENNSTNGQGMHAQGDNANRGFMQGYTTWLIVIVVIIALVIISYVLITRNMKKHIENNRKIMEEMLSTKQVKQSEQSVNKMDSSDNELEKKYQKTLLKFLNYNENRVMKTLLEHNGTVNQSEISRLPNMGKVKASRILRDMKQKEIITVESHGKINKIHLSDDLKSIFLVDKNK